MFDFLFVNINYVTMCLQESALTNSIWNFIGYLCKTKNCLKQIFLSDNYKFRSNENDSVQVWERTRDQLLLINLKLCISLLKILNN